MKDNGLRALVMLIVNAPVIPDPVLARARSVAASTDPRAGRVLAALLRRNDLPLAELVELNPVTLREDPGAAATHLNRPEHDDATRAALVAASPPVVLHRAVTAPNAHPATARALLAHARTLPADVAEELLERLSNHAADRQVGAEAQAAQLRAHAAAGPTALQGALRDFTKPYRDRPMPAQRADALSATDALAYPPVLLHVSRGSRSPQTAERVIAAITARPPATVPDADTAEQLLHASVHLTRYATGPCRAALARWWEQVQMPRGEDHDWLCARRRSVIAELDATTTQELLWDDLLSGTPFDGGSRVELAVTVAAALGEDPKRWETFLALAGSFDGTLEDLLAAVAGAHTAPALTGA